MNVNFYGSFIEVFINVCFPVGSLFLTSCKNLPHLYCFFLLYPPLYSKQLVAML